VNADSNPESHSYAEVSIFIPMANVISIHDDPHKFLDNESKRGGKK